MDFLQHLSLSLSIKLHAKISHGVVPSTYYVTPTATYVATCEITCNMSTIITYVLIKTHGCVSAAKK